MNITNTHGGPESALSLEKQSSDPAESSPLTRDPTSDGQSSPKPSPRESARTDPYSPSTLEEEQTSYEKIAEALVASGHANVEALLHVLQLKSKTLAETARAQAWDASRVLTSIRRRTPVPAGATAFQRPVKSAADPAPAAAVCNSEAVDKDAGLRSKKSNEDTAAPDPLKPCTLPDMSSELTSAESSPSLISSPKKSPSHLSDVRGRCTVLVRNFSGASWLLKYTLEQIPTVSVLVIYKTKANHRVVLADEQQALTSAGFMTGSVDALSCNVKSQVVQTTKRDDEFVLKGKQKLQNMVEADRRVVLITYSLLGAYVYQLAPVVSRYDNVLL